MEDEPPVQDAEQGVCTTRQQGEEPALWTEANLANDALNLRQLRQCASLPRADAASSTRRLRTHAHPQSRCEHGNPGQREEGVEGAIAKRIAG